MDRAETNGITPELILAYLDGADLPRVAAYLRSSPAAASLAAEYGAVDAALTRALYRYDCPPSERLGEYALGLLPAAERFVAAAHVDGCPHCAGELAQIRAFLAVEADAPPAGALERVRRLIATLVSPPPLGFGAALRGGDEATLIYQAEGFTITLDRYPTGRRDRHSLVGVLDLPAGLPAGSATLTAADGATATEPLDEGGNFAFDAVPAGRYRLEVALGEVRITIPELRVGD